MFNDVFIKMHAGISVSVLFVSVCVCMRMCIPAAFPLPSLVLDRTRQMKLKYIYLVWMHIGRTFLSEVLFLISLYQCDGVSCIET